MLILPPSPNPRPSTLPGRGLTELGHPQVTLTTRLRPREKPGVQREAWRGKGNKTKAKPNAEGRDVEKRGNISGKRRELSAALLSLAAAEGPEGRIPNRRFSEAAPERAPREARRRADFRHPAPAPWQPGRRRGRA